MRGVNFEVDYGSVFALPGSNGAGKTTIIKILTTLLHPNVEEQVDSLLLRFDLLEAADKRISEYSGGMSRKLDFAMSLMGSPSIVFMDEPTVGLDPQARMAM